MLTFNSNNNLTPTPFSKTNSSKADYKGFLAELQTELQKDIFVSIAARNFCKPFHVNKEIFAPLVEKEFLIKNTISKVHIQYRKGSKFHELTPERLNMVLSRYINTKYAESHARSAEKQKQKAKNKKITFLSPTNNTIKNEDIICGKEDVRVEDTNNNTFYMNSKPLTAVATGNGWIGVVNDKPVIGVDPYKVGDNGNLTLIDQSALLPDLLEEMQKASTSPADLPCTTCNEYDATWKKNGKEYTVRISVQGEGTPRELIEKGMLLMDL